MALAIAQTVFGYGSSLDWRPTTFVSPFPSTRLCSICGLVPPATATLPCRHLICQPCLDCLNHDTCRRKRCPLDKELFPEEDVVWSTHSNDNVMDRRVRCWNAANGCDAEDNASAMLDHFTNTCRFHAVKCPTCGGNVLHRHFANHLESGCVPTSCGNEQTLSENFVNAFLEVKDALGKISDENASLHTSLNSFEERLRSQRDRAVALQATNFNDALTTAVERIRETCRASLADHLREVTAERGRQQYENRQTMQVLLTGEFNRHMASLKAKIKQAFAEGCGRTSDDSASSSASCVASGITKEINQLVKDLSKEPTLTGEDASRVLKLLAAAALGDKDNALVKNPPPRFWEIDDWNDFCPESGGRGRQRRRDRFGSPYYLHGRLVVPRLCFYPRTDDVQYRPYIIKGLYDEFLDEPEEASNVRFVHPTGSSRYLEFTGDFSWVRPDHYFECMGSEVLYIGYNSRSIDVFTLEDDGFIADDSAELEIYHS
ncbi:uncharacterized protein [Dermacentor albipictus]|uniref:uncharacterized protein n=1 Tax=Dermacentor albipictus TaxID=60249 RepID=UPI0031FC498F